MVRFFKMFWLRLRMRYHVTVIYIYDFMSRFDKEHCYVDKAWDHLHKEIDLFNKLRKIRDSA